MILKPLFISGRNILLSLLPALTAVRVLVLFKKQKKVKMIRLIKVKNFIEDFVIFKIAPGYNLLYKIILRQKTTNFI